MCSLTHSMHSQQHTIAGFTLIEFLLYMALSVTMIVLIGSIGITVIQGNIKARAQEEVRYNAEFIIETILATAREAESADGPLVGASSTVLTLTREDPAKNPTMFGVQSGRVYIREGAEEPVLVSGEDTVVTALTFTNVSFPQGGSTLRIELELEAANPDDLRQQSASSTYTTTVYIPYSL